jgi:hypothetical protein
VSPLSLSTLFAAAKKVGAALHRGNARAAQAQRGCQRKGINLTTNNVADLPTKKAKL